MDRSKGCYVFQVLTSSECQSIIATAESHVAGAGKDLKWRKLYTYTKADLPMQDVSSFKPITKKLMNEICRVAAALYGGRAQDMHPRTWKGKGKGVGGRGAKGR